MLERARLRRDLELLLFCHIAHGAADGLLGGRGGDGLELEDRAAAEDGVEDIEIRVLRRGGDERDLAVFDVLVAGTAAAFC